MRDPQPRGCGIHPRLLRAEPRVCLARLTVGVLDVLGRDEIGILRVDVPHTHVIALHLVAVRLGLDQRRLRARNVRFGLPHRGGVVRVVEPRDDVALLDGGAFTDVEHGEPPGNLGGDSGLGARDDVSVRNHGDRAATAPYRPCTAGHCRYQHHLSRHRAAAAEDHHDRDDDHRGGDKPQHATQRPLYRGRWVVAIDSEFGEVCGRRRGHAPAGSGGGLRRIPPDVRSPLARSFSASPSGRDAGAGGGT